MKQSGVYAIVNRLNGHVYIGSSVDMSFRWTTHRYELNNRSHLNVHLQAAWIKYGQAAFEFAIVEILPISQLVQREAEIIGMIPEELRYNVAVDTKAPMRGRKHSAATLEKFKNRRWSKEVREKRGAAIKKAHAEGRHRAPGWRHTAETKDKIRAASIAQNSASRLTDWHIGRPHTAEAIEKIKHKRALQPHPFTGRRHTPEAKDKMRQAALRRYKRGAA